MLVLLDNFEDNLRPGGDAGYAVGDEVLAGLLAGWVADPGSSRLLVTCRYPFTLPGGAERALSFRQLGALSRAETMKLAWSLPALDRLDEGQLEQVWRLAGGHPRSLEYLDALLSGGTARYPDVTARLERGDHPPARAAPTAASGWPPAPGWMRRWPRPWRWPPTMCCSMTCWPAWPRCPGRRTCCWGSRCTGNRSTTTRCCSRPGSPTRTPSTSPTGRPPTQQITGILAAAGITVDESFDLASVPGRMSGRSWHRTSPS